MAFGHSERNSRGAIAGAEMAMYVVGLPIKASSGVAAAEEHYRSKPEPFGTINDIRALARVA